MYNMKRVRDFFTPGNVIYCDYWGMYDLVLAYDEGSRGAWNVTVCRCDVNGNRLEGAIGRTRNHCTYPDRRDRIIVQA